MKPTMEGYCSKNRGVSTTGPQIRIQPCQVNTLTVQKKFGTTHTHTAVSSQLVQDNFVQLLLSLSYCHANFMIYSAS